MLHWVARMIRIGVDVLPPESHEVRRRLLELAEAVDELARSR